MGIFFFIKNHRQFRALKKMFLCPLSLPFQLVSSARPSRPHAAAAAAHFGRRARQNRGRRPVSVAAARAARGLGQVRVRRQQQRRQHPHRDHPVGGVAPQRLRPAVARNRRHGQQVGQFFFHSTNEPI